MELKIGNKTYTTKTLTADFPIKFYKETGMDVFRLEEAEASLIEIYEIALHLAYALVGDGETFEEFCQEFTPADLSAAYKDIYDCYMETTSPKVESKGEKK